MLPSIVIAAFNHVLSGESWACKRLQNFTGKCVHVSIFPLIDLRAAIKTDGKFMITHTDDPLPDTSLTIQPTLVPRLISRNENAFDEIKITGDMALADELLFIAKNLHWDIEQDLSPLFGDILAHRMMQAGNSMNRWQSESTLNLSQAMIEFLAEEKSILASPAYIDGLTTEINSLQAQVTHLEERVNQLIALSPLKTENNISLQTRSNETS